MASNELILWGLQLLQLGALIHTHHWLRGLAS